RATSRTPRRGPRVTRLTPVGPPAASVSIQPRIRNRPARRDRDDLRWRTDMSLGEREVPRPQSTSDADAASSSEPVFRPPTAADGQRMWEITRDSGVLDVNSSYAYVLWWAEFSDSSVVVESEGRVVGFVTGFIRQSEPDTIFVWQVGVDADQRGKGLAARMLHALFDRTADRGVVRMRTTISPDNTASQRTFGAVARDRGLTFGGEDFLSADLMGEGHEPEDLYTLG